MVVYMFVFVSVFAWCPICLKTYGDLKTKLYGMLFIDLCCLWLLWDKKRFWSIVYSLCFIIVVSMFLLERWKCLEYCAHFVSFQGWTKFYEFSLSDLRAGADIIDRLCVSGKLCWLWTDNKQLMPDRDIYSGISYYTHSGIADFEWRIKCLC